MIARDAGPLLDLSQFAAVYLRRMQQLIAPAKDHELPVAIAAPGAIAPLLPTLHEIGFDIIHPISFDQNDIRAAKERWRDKLVFAGGVPADILRYGDQETIQQQVIETCQHLASDGGYIFGVSGAISDDIPPKNFVAMTQALHQYGRHPVLAHVPEPDVVLTF
jgi:uroporphyrinogen-III decarboxylase